MSSSRRDVWIDGQHFALSDDEYDAVRDATGLTPKELPRAELERLLHFLRGVGDPTDVSFETESAHDVEPVDPSRAREYAEYWVMVYGTGTQRKGVHVPGDDSTRADPALKCDRPVCDDAELVAKDLEVFPKGYDPSRICTDCRRELARELDLGRGGQRVE